MVHKPIRLPPLKKLKVRQPNKAEENPCIAVMSSVLGMLCAFLYKDPLSLLATRTN